jgi:hypothetical protein
VTNDDDVIAAPYVPTYEDGLGWGSHARRRPAAPAAVWTGLMAGFAPAPTDRTTTNSGDTGGPSLDCPKGSVSHGTD